MEPEHTVTVNEVAKDQYLAYFEPDAYHAVEQYGDVLVIYQQRPDAPQRHIAIRRSHLDALLAAIDRRQKGGDSQPSESVD